MMFTAKELRVLDAPTADNDVVLASLGGKPRMPKDIDEGGAESENPDTIQGSSDNVIAAEEDKWSAAERGVPREGVRERAGGWKEA